MILHQCTLHYILPYSLNFSRDKYFVVLLNSAQKTNFMDKCSQFKLPTTSCIRYELEILWEKIFVAVFQPVKSTKTSKLLGYTHDHAQKEVGGE